MVRFAVVCIVGCAGCRARPARPFPTSDAAVDVGSGARTVKDRSPRVHWDRPMRAVRIEGGVAVVGRDRETRQLAFGRLYDRAPANDSVVPLPPGLDEPELLTSAVDLGLVARPSSDAGGERLLLRLRQSGDGGSPADPPEPLGTVSCSTSDGVFSLTRNDAGWKGSFLSLTTTAGQVSGPSFVGRSEITLVCGTHRVYVVTNVAGDLRAATWSAGDKDVAIASLPKLASATGDGDTLMNAMDDKLVVARFDGAGFHALVWPSEKADSAWRGDSSVVREGVALERFEPSGGRLGLLFMRTVSHAKGCKGRDATDAIAEAAIFDVATGKLVRPPKALETWKCGSEPGPFFSGWAAGKLVIAWPRGADAACSDVGVRRGGVGYAEVDPESGNAMFGRIARPAEAIVDAGCDARQCYAVALTRGANPCAVADDAERGTLEVVEYPYRPPTHL